MVEVVAMSKLRTELALLATVLAIALGGFSVLALAAESHGAQALPIEAPGIVAQTTPDEDMADDADGLIAGYIERRIEAELAASSDAPLLRGRPNSYGLEGNDLRIFNELKALIAEVAAGKRNSSQFWVRAADAYGQTSWTAEELGVERVYENGALTQEAMDAATEKVKFNAYKIVKALLLDCPYELYWYDKTQGYQCYDYETFAFRHDTSDGQDIVVFPYSSLLFKLYVSPDYAVDGQNGSLSVDTATGARVTAAVDTATEIASEGSDLSAYDRLKHFKDRICELTDYNHDAADDSSMPYGDPWQLIYVFDGDESTDVVCEGYSKAFQYLCDLARIPDIDCYTVEGMMYGSSAGGHMWNLVKMDDCEVYLVDVTNCDEGAAGYPDRLFVVPYYSGTATDGYTFDTGTRTLLYRYDNRMFSLFTQDELSVSATPYEVPAYVSIDGATIADIPDQTYTGFGIEPSPTVTLDGEELTPGRDYTLSFEANVDVGEAMVTVVGAGNYVGSVTVTFRILPASIEDAVVYVEDQTYTGLELMPEIVVRYQGSIIDPGCYDAAYSNNVEVGTASVVVTFKGNYSGSAMGSFRIEAAAHESGWAFEDGAWRFYLDDGTALTDEWAQKDGEWFYLGPDGTIVTSEWISYGGLWYFVNDEGNPVFSEWVFYEGQWYFVNAYGNPVVNNWVSYGGKWYFVNVYGNPVVSDWVYYRGAWYFVNAKGNPVVSDWVYYRGAWYFVNAKGNPVVSDWVSYAGQWYYVNSKGNPVVSSWVSYGGKWYYVDAKGNPVTDTSIVFEGVECFFDEHGVCVDYRYVS